MQTGGDQHFFKQIINLHQLRFISQNPKMISEMKQKEFGTHILVNMNTCFFIWRKLDHLATFTQQLKKFHLWWA